MTPENLNSLTPRVTFNPLADSYPLLYAFISGVGWLVLLPVVLIIDWLVPKFQMPWFAPIIVLGLTIISALYGFFYAKSCGYAVHQYDVFFKQGIWWKKQTALNFSRVQHIDISHGPLERKLALATIKFFTAGGMGSDLSISGLPNETAEQIRLQILKYAGDALEEELKEQENANSQTSDYPAISESSKQESQL